MSRRSRVPRRKQLGGQYRQRNANPKLSPFQKEQKRNKMANQPPVNLQTRDFPAKARKLQAFLTAGKKKFDQRREANQATSEYVPRGEWEMEFVPTTLEVPDAAVLKAEPKPQPVDDAADLVGASSDDDEDIVLEEVEESSDDAEEYSSDDADDEDDAGSEMTISDDEHDEEEEEEDEMADDDADELAQSSARRQAVELDDDEVALSDDDMPKKAKKPLAQKEKKAAAAAATKSKKAAASVDGAVSLNQHLQATSESVVDNVTLKRLEKRRLKALKKREARKAERIDKLTAKSEALEMLVNKKSAKRLQNDDEMREAALSAINAANTTQRRKKKKAKAQGDAAADDADEEVQPQKGHQSTTATSAATAPAKPVKEFEDLVDHVGFGERADAPPTFDVLPSDNAALVPAQHVGKAKRARLLEEARREKMQRAITGEAKPKAGKIVETPLPGGGQLVAPAVKNARLESADDFAALRERVMQRYAKANKGTFNQRRRDIKFSAEP